MQYISNLKWLEKEIDIVMLVTFKTCWTNQKVLIHDSDKLQERYSTTRQTFLATLRVTSYSQICRKTLLDFHVLKSWYKKISNRSSLTYPHAIHLVYNLPVASFPVPVCTELELQWQPSSWQISSNNKNPRCPFWW